jgi:hypothetical protein
MTQQGSKSSARPEHEAENEQHERDGFEPRGTLIFVLIMLLGYALYWAYLWFIVVIERGG